MNNIESSKLIYLYLDDNKIGDISDLEKINLNNLSSISINGNQLTHFPKTLSMKKLTDLNL
jgi:Leucine-rich repeat (LRR) protein